MRERSSSSAILSTLKVGVGFGSPFLDKCVLLWRFFAMAYLSQCLFYRLLPHFLSTKLLTPARLTNIVVLSKKILFPNGYPGPPPVVPTLEEQAALRSNLERRLMELIPSTCGA